MHLAVPSLPGCPPKLATLVITHILHALDASAPLVSPADGIRPNRIARKMAMKLRRRIVLKGWCGSWAAAAQPPPAFEPGPCLRQSGDLPQLARTTAAATAAAVSTCQPGDARPSRSTRPRPPPLSSARFRYACRQNDPRRAGTARGRSHPLLCPWRTAVPRLAHGTARIRPDGRPRARLHSLRHVEQRRFVEMIGQVSHGYQDVLAHQLLPDSATRERRSL